MKIVYLSILLTSAIAANPYAVIINDSGFSVQDEDGTHDVQRCFVDKQVRDMDHTTLDAFLKVGFLKARLGSDGEYSIQSSVRGEGGGPVLGFCAYWGVKGILYGIPALVGGLVGRRIGRGQEPIDPHIAAHMINDAPEIAAAAAGTTATIVATGGYGAFVEALALKAGLAAGMAPTI